MLHLSPSLGKCLLLGWLYCSLWWAWGGGPGWLTGGWGLVVDWAPVESRLDPDGSGLKGFFLAGSSFFLCSFCMKYEEQVSKWYTRRKMSLRTVDLRWAYLFLLWTLLLSHLIQLVQFPGTKLSKFGHKNPQVSEKLHKHGVKYNIYISLELLELDV